LSRKYQNRFFKGVLELKIGSLESENYQRNYLNGFFGNISGPYRVPNIFLKKKLLKQIGCVET